MRRTPSRLHLTLLGLTILILALGIIAVYDASVYEAYIDFGDKFHFARNQLIWAVVGLTAMFIASFIPPPIIKQLAVPTFLVCLGLMVLVLIPGLGQQVQGARRWLKISSFHLQPSELLKPALIIYLSAWLQDRQNIFNFIAILAVAIGLTMLQPDLGTAVVLATVGFIIYYLSGANIKHVSLLVILGVSAVALAIFISPYRRQRLLTFINPTQDPLGSSYHINQVLIALGSGGWTGLGLGRSRQKYRYLPEATTDSIFAIIAEETGFLGAALIVFLLLSLILVGYKIARSSKTGFNKLLAGGISSWLAVQTLFNISAMVALIPLTGIPLPLISYGGSSLITTLAGLGMLISVAKTEKL